jgi:hypothetical protein
MLTILRLWHGQVLRCDQVANLLALPNALPPGLGFSASCSPDGGMHVGKASDISGDLPLARPHYSHTLPRQPRLLYCISRRNALSLFPQLDGEGRGRLPHLGGTRKILIDDFRPHAGASPMPPFATTWRASLSTPVRVQWGVNDGFPRRAGEPARPSCMQFVP